MVDAGMGRSRESPPPSPLRPNCKVHLVVIQGEDHVVLPGIFGLRDGVGAVKLKVLEPPPKQCLSGEAIVFCGAIKIARAHYTHLSGQDEGVCAHGCVSRNRNECRTKLFSPPKR